MKFYTTSSATFGLSDDAFDKITHFVKGLPDGWSLEIKITPARPRTENVNRYYRGVVIPIVQKGLQATQGESFTKDEAHEWVKQNFNYDDEGVQSTSALTGKEFWMFIDKLNRHCIEYFGTSIPKPRKK